MSSATDFGCKVTARKLRSKIFPPFFSKFFAINDTCQSIVKLSNCQIVKHKTGETAHNKKKINIYIYFFLIMNHPPIENQNDNLTI